MQRMTNTIVRRIINGCLGQSVPNVGSTWREKLLPHSETLIINSAFIVPSASMCNHWLWSFVQLHTYWCLCNTMVKSCRNVQGPLQRILHIYCVCQSKYFVQEIIYSMTIFVSNNFCRHILSSYKNVQPFYVCLFLNYSRKFGAGDKVTYNGKDYLCKPCLVASELQKAQTSPRKVDHSGLPLLLWNLECLRKWENNSSLGKIVAICIFSKQFRKRCGESWKNSNVQT